MTLFELIPLCLLWGLVLYGMLRVTKAIYKHDRDAIPFMYITSILFSISLFVTLFAYYSK